MFVGRNRDEQEEAHHPTPMPQLVLLRHGESVWNGSNRFCGWVDVPLLDKGRAEAVHAGELIAKELLAQHSTVAAVFTLLLDRLVASGELVVAAVLRAVVQPPPAVHRSWLLNERHYGRLQGLDKLLVLARVGKDKYMAWRRLYTVPPPLVDDPLVPNPEIDEFLGLHSPKYAGVDPAVLPRGELLEMVLTNRVAPYYHSHIWPALARCGEHECVVVVAHGLTIRALCKMLYRLSDSEVEELNIATAMPMVVQVGEAGAVGLYRYLDPVAASAGAARVKAQGFAAPPQPDRAT